MPMSNFLQIAEEPLAQALSNLFFDPSNYTEISLWKDSPQQKVTFSMRLNFVYKHWSIIYVIEPTTVVLSLWISPTWLIMLYISQSKRQAITQQQRNNRRKRASPRQLAFLRRKFQEDPKPDQLAREIIGRQIDMTPRSVQIWFQNNRAKARVQERKLASLYHVPITTSSCGDNVSRVHLDVGAMHNASKFYGRLDFSTSAPAVLSRHHHASGSDEQSGGCQDDELSTFSRSMRGFTATPESTGWGHLDPLLSNSSDTTRYSVSPPSFCTLNLEDPSQGEPIYDPLEYVGRVQPDIEGSVDTNVEGNVGFANSTGADAGLDPGFEENLDPALGADPIANLQANLGAGLGISLPMNLETSFDSGLGASFDKTPGGALDMNALLHPSSMVQEENHYGTLDSPDFEQYPIWGVKVRRWERRGGKRGTAMYLYYSAFLQLARIIVQFSFSESVGNHAEECVVLECEVKRVTPITSYCARLEIDSAPSFFYVRAHDQALIPGAADFTHGEAYCTNELLVYGQLSDLEHETADLNFEQLDNEWEGSSRASLGELSPILSPRSSHSMSHNPPASDHAEVVCAREHGSSKRLSEIMSYP